MARRNIKFSVPFFTEEGTIMAAREPTSFLTFREFPKSGSERSEAVDSALRIGCHGSFAHVWNF